jgi:hypothetical protein
MEDTTGMSGAAAGEWSQTGGNRQPSVPLMFTVMATLTALVGEPPQQDPLSSSSRDSE